MVLLSGGRVYKNNFGGTNIFSGYYVAPISRARRVTLFCLGGTLCGSIVFRGHSVWHH